MARTLTAPRGVGANLGCARGAATIIPCIAAAQLKVSRKDPLLQLKARGVSSQQLLAMERRFSSTQRLQALSKRGAPHSPTQRPRKGISCGKLALRRARAGAQMLDARPVAMQSKTRECARRSFCRALYTCAADQRARLCNKLCVLFH